MRSDRWNVIVLLLLIAGPLPPAGWWLTWAIGVNWGTFSSHPLPPATVVSELLRSNNVTRVKLLDAEPTVLESLSGTGIAVIVGIPNEMLEVLNSSKKAAASWVHDNITRYFPDGGAGGGVRIQYIAVGDEPFLLSYGERFHSVILGSAINIQLALVNAKLADRIKVIVPCSSDVCISNSTLPSTSRFRPDLNQTIVKLLSFLTKYHSPFVIDINPFASLQQNKNLTMDYFLFQPRAHPLSDGHHRYENFFDSSIDSIVTCLSKAGFNDLEIMVGKIGWPTDGMLNATASLSETFIKGLVDRVQSKAGTPLRPKKLVEIYIFSLFDEDRRNITTGTYERHFGIFTFDGQAKYNVDLGQGSRKLANAKNVDYLSPRWCVINNNRELSSNVSESALNACANADCTTLSPGGSCSGIGWPGNVSYAFNSYYQQHDQSAESCDFGGLGLITTVDPSVGDCRFTIALRTSSSTSFRKLSMHLWTRFPSGIVFINLLCLLFIVF